MSDDNIERLRLRLETKKANNENSIKREELRLREREIDNARVNGNAEATGITAPRATIYAAVATLIGGVLGAEITGFYSQNVKSTKGASAIDLERTKFETGLILKAIETNDQEHAVTALKFLAKAGLIPNYEEKIKDLAENDKEAIPALGANRRFTQEVARWGVKTGTDADVALVGPTSQPILTTIDDLVALPRPGDMPLSEDAPAYQDKRAKPVETSIYGVEASIVGFKLEPSGDIKLIIQGDSGRMMMAAAPYDNDLFVPDSSRWKAEIEEVRARLNDRLFVTTQMQETSPMHVRLAGVGFFNRVHGQTGGGPKWHRVAPIVAITFTE